MRYIDERTGKRDKRIEGILHKKRERAWVKKHDREAYLKGYYTREKDNGDLVVKSKSRGGRSNAKVIRKQANSLARNLSYESTPLGKSNYHKKVLGINWEIS